VSAEFVAPDVDAEQVLTFTLTVTDQGGLSSTDEVSITVAVVVVGSSAPVANAGADQSVTEGGSVTLDGSASSDVDDNIASYSWVQSAGDSVSLNNADTVTASFTAPSVSTVSTITLSLTVTDTAGNSSTDDISVTVNPETTTTPPPTTGNNDGGGGAIGWLSLMALMLFAYRYTQANKR
ncbi:MAG: GlyGly-CTERM sorting domain-containing protein, partial [Paraglaciecola sp.]|nr:GlyGly-CTERM sorting domain-containing protein [Paraglaciecola sp.]